MPRDLARVSKMGLDNKKLDELLSEIEREIIKITSSTSLEVLQKTHLKLIFNRLKQYFRRMEMGLGNFSENDPHLTRKIINYFKCQGYAFSDEYIKDFAISYANCVENYDLLEKKAAGVIEDKNGVYSIELIYIDLLKLYKDTRGFVGRLVECTSIIPSDDKFIVREEKILKELCHVLDQRLLPEAYFVFAHSRLIFCEVKGTYFETNIIKLQQTTYERIQNLEKEFKSYIDNVKSIGQNFVTDEEILFFYEQLELFKNAVRSIINLIASKNMQYEILRTEASILLSLEDEVSHYFDFLEEENAHRKAEASKVVEVEQSITTLSVSDSPAQVEMKFTPQFDQVHSEKESKKREAPVEEDSAPQEETIIKWSEKLKDHQGLLDKLFSAKPQVNLREILKLIEVIGGQWKKQKAGVGIQVPMDVQKDYPCSSGSVYTAGTHFPHGKRHEKNLSLRFVDNIKKFLEMCELTPQKLWPKAANDGGSRKVWKGKGKKRR